MAAAGEGGARATRRAPRGARNVPEGGAEAGAAPALSRCQRRGAAGQAREGCPRPAEQKLCEPGGCGPQGHRLHRGPAAGPGAKRANSPREKGRGGAVLTPARHGRWQVTGVSAECRS